MKRQERRIWTLVCLRSDDRSADTTVLKSFGSLDGKAAGVIRECIMRDFEDTVWDAGESVDTHFLTDVEKMKELDTTATEETGQEGIPIWECEEGDGRAVTTYLLHRNILEEPDGNGVMEIDESDFDFGIAL